MKTMREGIRSRVNQNGVIELWLGEPGHAESDCIAQFHKDYLNGVVKVMENIHKSPRYSGNQHFGVRKHG